ncbi:MAG: response regulator [Alphaproteobacteria bacterium]|nr:response regulator [Alphaproteobacteria bacterium]
MRALVIDDSELVRDFVARCLQRAGHEAMTASNGREGLARFDAGQFDVVVSDIFMPECDGLEVMKELRRRAPGTAIVLMSGGTPSIDHDYLAIAERLGASATLQKPFLPAELLRAVDRAMDRPLMAPAG